MKHLFITIIILLFSLSAFPQKWVKVWSDEFNKKGLPDSTKWDYTIGLVTDILYYTYKKIENAHIDDTTLIIEARKESYLGANFTSASIISRYLGDWKYGRIEVCAKIPTGKGTWPAIWMMPTDNKYGLWPKSGEIDIMENVGFQPENIYTTVHYFGTDGSGHQDSGSHVRITNPYSRFVVYAVEWNSDKIDWWVDGQKVFTYNRLNSVDYRLWPFNQKFYLILNLAIGGEWAAQQGIDDAIFPLKFYIDYVRVYQWQDKPGPYNVTLNNPEGGTVAIENPQSQYPDGTKIKLIATPKEGYSFLRWQNLGAANPIELEVNKDYDIIAIFQKKGELIRNGNFNDSLTFWNNQYFYDKNVDQATSSVVNNQYVINVTQKGTDWWQIGDQQLFIPIEGYTNYLLTFDAYCDNPSTLGVTLAKNYGDYSSYYTNMFNLTTSNKNYTWKFTMNQSPDLNCRLYFGVGNFSGKVYFDNISLVKFNPTAIMPNRYTDTQLNIFPNPTQEELEVEFTINNPNTAVLEVLNANGVLMKQFPLNGSIIGYNRLSFILNGFAKGTYFLRMKTNSKVITKKFLLQ